MKILVLLAVWVTFAAQARAASAVATSSRTIPFNSWNIQKALSLDDYSDDNFTRAYILEENGSLLSSDESAQSLNPDQLANLKAVAFTISQDPPPNDDVLNPQVTSTLTLLTPAGAEQRQIQFTLPGTIHIDTFGNPVGLDKLTSSAYETDQSVAVSFHLTAPQAWQTYSKKGNVPCQTVEYQNVCNAAMNCQTIAVTSSGTQSFDIEGQSKTESYTLILNSDSATQADSLGFDLNYDQSTETFGPCVTR